MKFSKIIAVFLLLSVPFMPMVSAATITIGDNQTHRTLFSALQNANESDTIILDTNLLYEKELKNTNTETIVFKGIILDGNNNSISLRGGNISLEWNAEFKNLTFDWLADGVLKSEIQSNGKNLRLDNVVFSGNNSGNAFVNIIAGDELNLNDAKNINEIIIENENSNIAIAGNTDIVKVVGKNGKSGNIHLQSQKVNAFENVKNLTFDLSGNARTFSVNNIDTIDVQMDRIPFSNFENINQLKIWNNATIVLPEDAEISVEKIISWENSTIIIPNSSSLAVKNIEGEKINFEIDAGGRRKDEAKQFVILENNSQKNLIAGDLKSNGKITENTIDKTNLKNLLNAYDALDEWKKSKEFLESFNAAVDVSLDENATQEQVAGAEKTIQTELDRVNGISPKPASTTVNAPVAVTPTQNTNSGTSNQATSNGNSVNTSVTTGGTTGSAPVKTTNTSPAVISSVSGGGGGSNYYQSSSSSSSSSVAISNWEQNKKTENSIDTNIKTPTKDTIFKKNISINGEKRFFSFENTSCELQEISGVQDFRDISKNNNIESINFLMKKGIISGTTPTTFEPNRAITRAEFLKIALKSHCYDIEKAIEKPHFPDVTKNSWQASVTEIAYKNGIISGYADRNFGPNNPISRSEALKILFSLRKITIPENVVTSYKDTANNWQKSVITKAEYLGITHPVKTNYTFNVNDSLSRDEMAKMIVNILHLYK